MVIDVQWDDNLPNSHEIYSYIEYVEQPVGPALPLRLKCQILVMSRQNAGHGATCRTTNDAGATKWIGFMN